MSKKTKTKKEKKSSIGFFLPVICIAIAVLIIFVSGKLSDRSYPRNYEQAVYSTSEKYGLDPDLVFAVIRTESRFQSNAVSRSGALGLMQVMPETGKWIAWRKNEEQAHSDERLFEPEYNIEMGCYLLSYLLEHYDNDIELAVAAYNAGPGNVDKWLKDEAYYDGKTLSIPFDETRNYVKKVMSSYEKYQKKK